MLAQNFGNQTEIGYLIENTPKARGDINYPTLACYGDNRRQQRVDRVIDSESSNLARKV